MPPTAKPALSAQWAAAQHGTDVDALPALHRPLRISVVSETYPPEVNGVATTVARTVQGLRALGHDLQLVRPRQQAAETGDQHDRFQKVLTRSLSIPRYPQLKMGLPSRRVLLKLWRKRRPDVVHIAN